MENLYDRPVLAVDPGMHTAEIVSLAVDRDVRFIVTGSADKTIRIWNAADGTSVNTVYPPQGPDKVGSIYAVAISPDGNLIAAGGWTSDNAIYLIDAKRGNIFDTIPGIPNLTASLAFSPNGRYLVAGTVGLRVFDRDQHWASVGRDDDYRDLVTHISFAADGRFAAGTQDGLVRLYDAQFRSLKTASPYGRHTITSMAFRSDGKRLAIGSTQYPCVSILDGQTLESLHIVPATSAVAGDKATVAWSNDGEKLLLSTELRVVLGGASGQIIECDTAGQGECREHKHWVGSTVSFMVPTKSGDLVVGGNSIPYLGVFDPSGELRWEHRSRVASFPLAPVLQVNNDGSTVDFRFEANPRVIRFSLTDLKVEDRPRWDSGDSKVPTDPKVGIDRNGVLAIGGQPVRLESDEEAQSFAAFQNSERFVVGTNFSLYLFGEHREKLWSRPLTDVALDIKVTGNGRLAVAAIADGTIRWFRVDDGTELLAMMPLSRNVAGLRSGREVSADTIDWIAWTPDGFYTSTKDAASVLKWLTNQADQSQAISVPVSRIPRLDRPDVIRRLAQDRDILTALGQAELGAVRRAIQTATGSQQLPGARLYVVAVGVSDYGPKAGRVGLKFADNDASELLKKLDETQGASALYSRVVPMLLENEDASKKNIFQALDLVESEMSRGDNRDVAVVMFSGHGARIDDDLYLLPYGVDVTTLASVEASAIPAEQLGSKIAKIARHGFAIVLLDACRSGAVTNDGSVLKSDASAMKDSFSDSAVEVLTSSSGDEDSIEDPTWKHGAFTEALLEELTGEPLNKGRTTVSIGELARDVASKLLLLTTPTGNAQHLGVSPGFARLATQIFVVGK
jgi:WD40 repeat protein